MTCLYEATHTFVLSVYPSPIIKEKFKDGIGERIREEHEKKIVSCEPPIPSEYVNFDCDDDFLEDFGFSNDVVPDDTGFYTVSCIVLYMNDASEYFQTGYINHYIAIGSIIEKKKLTVTGSEPIQTGC